MELLQNHIHVNVSLDLPVIYVINQSDHRPDHVTSTNVKMVQNVSNQSEINISVNVLLVTLVIIVKSKYRK